MKTSDKYLCIFDCLINSDDFKTLPVTTQYEILKELIEQTSLAKFAEKREEKHD